MFIVGAVATMIQLRRSEMLRDATLIVYCAPMELSKVLARVIYKHFIPTGFTLIKNRVPGR